MLVNVHLCWGHLFEQSGSFPREGRRQIRKRAHGLLHQWVHVGVWEDIGESSTKWNSSGLSSWLEVRMDAHRQHIQWSQPGMEKVKKQGVEIKHIGPWPSHFGFDKPTSSRMSVVPSLKQTFPAGNAGLVRSVRVALWLRPSSLSAIEESAMCPEQRKLAWGAAKVLRCDLPCGGSSCPLCLYTEPKEWADFWINQNQFRSLKLKFHRSSAYPMAHWPWRGWRNTWNHMSQFD